MNHVRIKTHCVNFKPWFGILGGALAWLCQLLIASFVSESACVLDGTWFTALGISAAGWLLILVSILALVLGIGSLKVAWYLRKNHQESVRFMGKAGVIADSIFILIILAQMAPIPILLSRC